MGKREAKVVKKKDDYDFLGIDVSTIQVEIVRKNIKMKKRNIVLNLKSWKKILI